MRARQKLGEGVEGRKLGVLLVGSVSPQSPNPNPKCNQWPYSFASSEGAETGAGAAANIWATCRWAQIKRFCHVLSS